MIDKDMKQRRELTQSLEGDTWKYMMRQGGQHMDFSNRSEHLEYIAKIYAYVLPWMPKEVKIAVGYDSFKGMLGYYQPEVDYGVIRDVLFSME